MVKIAQSRRLSSHRDSCADYVKYLISLNKEKEDKINKVRCDLEAAKAKVEDKKSSLERSDPESTTSSLTVSSNSASKDGRAFVDTTSETSKVIGERGNGPSRRVQLSSGISDLTESNKSSSQPSMESGSDLSPPVVTSTSTSGESTLRSLPHERASISGATLSRQKKRKRKLDDDLTSLDEGFQLDYEEVFLKSNVPQLLATSTGRIVSCKCDGTHRLSVLIYAHVFLQGMMFLQKSLVSRKTTWKH